MKHKNIVLGVALVLAALLVSGASAAPLFLADWGISYNNWTPNANAPANFHSVVENWTGGNGGYLDPGAGGDLYDAEFASIAWDDDYLYLSVITGFPRWGRWEGPWFYAAGDLALDVTGDGVYDFAIDVSRPGRIRSGNLGWENPSFQGQDESWGGVSDPLRVNSWSQTDFASAYRYGYYSGRYAIEAKIDRNILGPTSSYELHWTMGCGNDGIDVVANPVPEPATLLLLGGGLAMAGIASRLRRKED